MKQIPVFFVHIGDASYLKTVVTQARKYNDLVFLIGDESNKSYCDNWCNIYDYYGEEYKLLKTRYKHMSTNSYNFEFSAIAKFLAVYHFAMEKNFSQIMLLDSDLMTYTDFSKLNWENIDAGFSIPEKQEPYIWTISVHCSFWTIHALKSFIEYLLSVYINDLAKLEEKWNYDQAHNRTGGICDMTLVYLWYKKHPEMTFFNTAKVYNNTVFDHFIYASEGFRVGDFKVNTMLKMKLIKFNNGIPFFKYKDGQWIRSYTIHAQGAKKRYIELFSKCVTSTLPYYFISGKFEVIHIKNGILRILHINKK